jgi:hypothetical protein
MHRENQYWELESRIKERKALLASGQSSLQLASDERENRLGGNTFIAKQQPKAIV